MTIGPPTAPTGCGRPHSWPREPKGLLCRKVLFGPYQFDVVRNSSASDGASSSAAADAMWSRFSQDNAAAAVHVLGAAGAAASAAVV